MSFFYDYSVNAIPFIIGIIVIGGLLVALIVSLICLCLIRRKQKKTSEYSQVETDSDSEFINLKELTSFVGEKRKLKEKKNRKRGNFDKKISLTDEFILESGFKSLNQKKDYLLSNDNYGCTTPLIEKEYMPVTVAMPIPSTPVPATEDDRSSTENVHKPRDTTHTTSSTEDSEKVAPIKPDSETNSEESSQLPFSTTVHTVSGTHDNFSVFSGITEIYVDEDFDKTLVCPNDDSNADQVPSTLPPTYHIPRDIADSNDPARGLLAFSLSLRRLNSDSDPVSLLVHVFEARCILTGQMRHDAWFGVGKFYVKAKFHSTALKRSPSTGSIASLDQSILSRSLVTRLGSNHSGNNNSTSGGRTKAKSACRTVRFLETIELPFPKPWRKLISASNSSGQHEISIGDKRVTMLSRKRSISTSELDVKPFELGLRLSLKQRESQSKAIVLKRLNLRLAGKIELGTVSVSCPPHFLQMIDTGSASIGHRAPECSTLKPFVPGDVGTTQVSQPGVLRMVQEISPLVNSSPGSIALAVQWRIETQTLVCRAIDCSSISVPLGTKQLFVSYALMTNSEILNKINSKPAVRHSLTACEFLLTDTVQFSLDKYSVGTDQVCLGVALVAALGSLKNCETLLGRVVLGPDGLAYGSGLRHWGEVTRKRGMIRRSHWFS